MKKKDIIFSLVLMVVIGLGYGIYTMFQGEKDIVEVFYKNELVKQIDINVDGIYEFEGSYGHFYIEVVNGEYHATDVECPNHDCEKVGWVPLGSSKTIVCVPNEIYVIQSGLEEGY